MNVFDRRTGEHVHRIAGRGSVTLLWEVERPQKLDRLVAPAESDAGAIEVCSVRVGLTEHLHEMAGVADRLRWSGALLRVPLALFAGFPPLGRHLHVSEQVQVKFENVSEAPALLRVRLSPWLGSAR